MLLGLLQSIVSRYSVLAIVSLVAWNIAIAIYLCSFSSGCLASFTSMTKEQSILSVGFVYVFVITLTQGLF